MYSPKPVIHVVTQSSEWPAEVQDIANRLSRRLPDFSKEPLSYISPIAYPLLTEVVEKDSTTNLEYCLVTGEEDEMMIPVHHMADMVLSTVASLRSLTQARNALSPPNTFPLWKLLFQALVHLLSTNIQALSGVPFTMPQPFSPNSSWSPNLFEGVSELLISLILDNEEVTEDSEYIEDDAQRSEYTTDTAFKILDGAPDSQNESYRSHDSEHSVVGVIPSLPSLANVPFDAHVVKGRGRRFCAILPLICIADEQNILPLLISVLYQRRVWNIDDPVIGLTLTRTGTAGRTFLGWLERNSEHDQTLPTPHIAAADEVAGTDFSVGKFDMTDPSSALSLAQFILGLGTHFHSISTACDERRFNPLHWRSDHLDIDDDILEDENNDAWESRTRLWLDNIDPCIPTSSSPENVTSCVQAPTASRLSPFHPNSDALQYKCRSINDSSDSGSETSQTKVLQSSNKKSQLGDSDAGSIRTQFSSSAFAKLPSHIGELNITSWLVERGVVTVACIEIPENIEYAKEINPMVKIYNDMTDIRYPKEWNKPSGAAKSVDELLNTEWRCDAGSDRYRKELFKQYSEYKPIGGVLKDGHSRIIREQFSSLLSVISEIKLNSQIVYGARGLIDGEHRFNWDVMNLHFYRSQDEPLATCVLMEKIINYPKNQALDALRDNEQRATSYVKVKANFMKQQVDHCMSVIQYVALPLDRDGVSIPSPPEVRRQAIAARNLAQRMWDATLDAMQLPAAQLVEKTNKRSDPEPHDGKCDAIFLKPITDYLSKIKNSDPKLTQAKLDEFLLVKVRASQQSEKESVEAEALELDVPGEDHRQPAPKVEKIGREGSKRNLDQPMENMSVQTALKILASPMAVPSEVQIPECSYESLEPHSGSTKKFKPSESLGVGKDDLLLPTMVVEYKKKSHDDGVTNDLNQVRMYIVSAVKFLAQLGITQYPVFGLATDGVEGMIVMGWQSEISMLGSTDNLDKDDMNLEDSKLTFMMERRICHLNLSNPLDAFRYATFLVRLREYNEQLEKKFFEQSRFPKEVSTGALRLTKWSRGTQMSWTLIMDEKQLMGGDERFWETYTKDGKKMTYHQILEHLAQSEGEERDGRDATIAKEWFKTDDLSKGNAEPWFRWGDTAYCRSNSTIAARWRRVRMEKSDAQTFHLAYVKEWRALRNSPTSVRTPEISKDETHVKAKAETKSGSTVLLRSFRGRL